MDTLPDEIILQILLSTSPTHRWRLCEVNSRFHNICKDKELWINFVNDLENRVVNSKNRFSYRFKLERDPVYSKLDIMEKYNYLTSSLPLVHFRDGSRRFHTHVLIPDGRIFSIYQGDNERVTLETVYEEFDDDDDDDDDVNIVQTLIDYIELGLNDVFFSNYKDNVKYAFVDYLSKRYNNFEFGEELYLDAPLLPYDFYRLVSVWNEDYLDIIPILRQVKRYLDADNN